MKLSPPRLISSALIAGLLAWLLAWQPFWWKGPAESCFLELAVASPQAGSLWVRIDEGHGIFDPVPTDIGGGFPRMDEPRMMRLKIPPGRIKAIKLSVFETPALLIRSARLRMEGGGVLADMTEDFQPLQNASAKATSAGLMVAVTPPHRGFSVMGTPKMPILVPTGDEPWALEVAAYFLSLTALLYLGQTVALERVSEARKQRWRGHAAEVAAGCGRRPALALGMVGLMAAAASSYPVLFCDKSFVSPNTFANLLYAKRPTIPGASLEPPEDVKNADAGIVMVQNLPYSVLEAQAMGRDHELPLWNRYSEGGLPLLGQGQSMFGDPLHLIPLLAGGAWWAWDLKYILAKALFCFGIGLCVWTLTRRLSVAALLCASAAWIGFFAFRFNHPAFFSLCYAPWVLLPWLGAREAAEKRSLLVAGAALMLGDWAELTSGTAKEATMLLVCLNGAGLLVAAVGVADWKRRWRRVAPLLWATFLFVLVSAPHWMVFLDALRHAVTAYDEPHAYQIQPGLLIALFDDIFSQDFTTLEMHTHPSVNFLALAGLLWLVANWTRKNREPAAVALAVAAFAVAALVFGVVPPAWIMSIPMLASIYHIDTTFCCVLIVLLLVLAGFGLRDCLEWDDPGDWKAAWGRSLFLLGSLMLLYFGFTQAASFPLFARFEIDPPWHSRFFAGYAPALALAAAALPLGLRWSRRSGEWRAAGICTVALCFVIVHFRHGMYVNTRFDQYVMNPRTGYDLAAHSPTIEALRQKMREPFRTYGFDQTLSPGYSAMLGLEGLSGPDALKNRYYQELVERSGLPKSLKWWFHIEASQLPRFKPMLDLLNLRYYLRERDSAGAKPALLWPLGGADLEVYESKEAWPRAFFTDYVGAYQTVDELIQSVEHGDGRPLAAVQGSVTPSAATYAERKIIPARDYRLTSNTTEFSVTAPGPGVVVLAENFEESNFLVTINGAPAPYFRVNHAFKGVRIDRAGAYRIRFSYWPRALTAALWIALLGLLLAAASASAAILAGRDLRVARARPTAARAPVSV